MDGCFGYCKQCHTTHTIKEGNAKKYAIELQKILEKEKRLDWNTNQANPKLNTNYLWGVARGQMFGILECLDTTGKTIILKAFSGQYNGIWNIAGWTSPLLNVTKYKQIVGQKDSTIKKLSKKINTLDSNSAEYQKLVKKRRDISRKQMSKIFSLYQLHNFAGNRATLSQAFSLAKGIPTGCGDCCAPKLLNSAAQQNLIPLGLAEFFWGKENRSKTRQHSKFYSCCQDKCQPILGFLLCGINNKK